LQNFTCPCTPWSMHSLFLFQNGTWCKLWKGTKHFPEPPSRSFLRTGTHHAGTRFSRWHAYDPFFLASVYSIHAPKPIHICSSLRICCPGGLCSVLQPRGIQGRTNCLNRPDRPWRISSRTRSRGIAVKVIVLPRSSYKAAPALKKPDTNELASDL
jgi:hypothetical protein